MFNSALIYELAVLKPYVEALLFGIDRGGTGIYGSQKAVEVSGLFCGNRSRKCRQIHCCVNLSAVVVSIFNDQKGRNLLYYLILRTYYE